MPDADRTQPKRATKQARTDERRLATRAVRLWSTDADSFLVDAYFEETQLAFMHEGDPAEIKLMSYRRIVSGEVGSVARGINVSNAQTDHPMAFAWSPV